MVVMEKKIITLDLSLRGTTYCSVKVSPHFTGSFIEMLRCLAQGCMGNKRQSQDQTAEHLTPDRTALANSTSQSHAFPFEKLFQKKNHLKTLVAKALERPLVGLITMQMTAGSQTRSAARAGSWALATPGLGGLQEKCSSPAQKCSVHISLALVLLPLQRVLSHTMI